MILSGVPSRAELDEFFRTGGTIQAALDTFDERPQQQQMAAAVYGALENRHHLVVEAPTGTGKTFAYLLPAFMRAAAGEGPIVVCTSTISLQEQLVRKDIPFLQRIFPGKVTAALMKGRSNYLCRRRLGQAFDSQMTLFDREEELYELERIAHWAAEPGEKTLSDLDPVPGGAVWGQVCAERGNCLGRKCPYYENCTWQDARRAMFTSDIIVVNYALFFNDLALRRLESGILPEYKAVIFDEAHEVPRLAADHLGLEMSSRQVSYFLDRLAHPRKKKGFLRISNSEDLVPSVRRARKAADAMFSDLFHWSENAAPENRRVRTAHIVHNSLSDPLRDLAKALEERSDNCSTEAMALETLSWANKAFLMAETAEALVAAEADNTVFWLPESRMDPRGFPQVTLKSSPIDVGTILKDDLFGRLDSVVCTSATLGVGSDEFEWFRGEIGMPSADTLALSSPFHLEAQVELHLHPELPYPGHPEFGAKAAPIVEKHISETAGGTLVLFTSYRMLEDFHRRIGGEIEDAGYTLLRQGDGTPRSTLIKRFREEIDSVLFATATFWQGIDIPGESLRNVVIVKLPFPVPTYPHLEARAERMQAAGGSPFNQMYLPEATMRLRQGFGRLIRRASDTGRVVILDSRIVSKSYGRAMIRALPECPIIMGGHESNSPDGF